jgi:hypothetical protein
MKCNAADGLFTKSSMLDEGELRYRMGGTTMQNAGDKRKKRVTLHLLVFMVSLHFCGVASAQEKSETTPCPKPYIKLIKPGLAKAGQQVIIRGHRFGKERKSGVVVFPPGINGKIISWAHSRIAAEVPSGAKSGKVIVKTGCAASIGEFLKIVE